MSFVSELYRVLLHTSSLGHVWLQSRFRSLRGHCVWKSQKMFHSTLRAKRATFTFWVDKSSLKTPKMVNSKNVETLHAKIIEFLQSPKIEDYFVPTQRLFWGPFFMRGNWKVFHSLSIKVSTWNDTPCSEVSALLLHVRECIFP